MTIEEKKVILHLASEVWVLRRWFDLTDDRLVVKVTDINVPGNKTTYDSLAVKKLLNLVSLTLVNISESGQSDAQANSSALLCALYMEIVNLWLERCADTNTVLRLSPKDVKGFMDLHPGEYWLRDVRKMGTQVMNGIVDWVTARPGGQKPEPMSVCPFCGGRAAVFSLNGRYGVQCGRTETCGAYVYFENAKFSSAETVILWQKRRSKQSMEAEGKRRGTFSNVAPGTDLSLLKRIRPCPFCGGMSTTFYVAKSGEKKFGMVECDRCGANAMFHSADDEKSMSDVIDRWNRRDGEEKESE